MSRLKKEMAQPVIVDLRNVYRSDEMAKHGFTYVSIGRTQASEPVLPAKDV
jgi:UDPglucose 6-dehydrogenase